MDKPKALLQELEWAGLQVWEVSNNDYCTWDLCPACPKCHGLQPDGIPYWRKVPMLFHVGHKPKCELKEQLDIYRLAGTPLALPEGTE